MKNWINFINLEEVKFIKIKKILKLTFDDLPFEVLEKQQLLYGEKAHFFLLENHIEVSLFKSSTHDSIILVEKEKRQIYINDFFYYTLIKPTLAELKCFILYLHISLKNKLTDLQIDIYQKSKAFKEHRLQKLNKEEIAVLNMIGEENKLNVMSWTYVSTLYKKDFQQLLLLEKKIIRDTLGSFYAKKLLGLDESLYKYIETEVDKSSTEYSLHQDAFDNINKEIERKKIFFEDFAHSHLKNKNMLIWTWWTISPFVAADLSILLPMISEEKTIKKIYLDLSSLSQNVFEDFLNGKIDDEKIVEDEIKKIYPPILKDYQKETLPYMILLEKIKMLGISIECFGFNGLDLMKKEPFLNQNNEIEYPIDANWRRQIFKEYQKLSDYQSDELVIFFQFMKPMYAIPRNLRDSRLEKIIHTDQFTGYGPNKPENSLAIFSRFTPGPSQSFVLPEVNNSSLREERIVFFPYKETPDFPKLEDSLFNRFGCYDSMIYSSFSENGGSHKKIETPEPAVFQPIY